MLLAVKYFGFLSRMCHFVKTEVGKHIVKG